MRVQWSGSSVAFLLMGLCACSCARQAPAQGQQATVKEAGGPRVPVAALARPASPPGDPFDGYLRTDVPGLHPLPQAERTLVLVDTQSRRMRLYRAGRAVGTFEVGFGQREGRKRRQGDRKTPLGMYFVVEKSQGPFPGRYGGFYGGYWIKVNYPGAADAAWGRSQGLLSEAQARRISEDWASRKATWQGSPLGGGIGFHGWAGPWDLSGPRRLSWGCIVMRNEDIAAVFDQIPLAALVVIF